MYVTSLGSERGNSLITAALGTAMRSRKASQISVAKPFRLNLSGLEKDDDLDNLQALGFPVVLEQVVLENEGEFTIDTSELAKKIASHSDSVVMDGVPIKNVGYGDAIRDASLSLVKSLRVPVVGVIDVGRDADTWFDYQGLNNDLEGLFLGVILNRVPRYRGHWVRSEFTPMLESAGIKVLAVVPESRKLAGISITQLASLVNGEVTHGQQYQERLVEHLMLGVNVMDSSIPYYQQRENKAVIVRGDRPDLQMGALATNTSCLVLTGDKLPVQYIEYEADKAEVPIICTANATAQVTSLLGGWTHLGGFAYQSKVEEISAFLTDDRLFSGLPTS